MRAAAALLVLAPAFAAAQPMGSVTPTEVTYHFTQASLQVADVDNQYRTLVETPFTYTFRRADPDFAAEVLEDVSIPFGRYHAVSVCFVSQVDILLDGVRYDGPAGARYRTGDLVTEPATSLSTSTYPVNCVQYAFPAVLCVTDDPGADCHPGDRVLADAGDRVGDGGTIITDFSLNLLVDLYHSVWIDADTGTPRSYPGLQITWGRPGAAVHLATSFPSGTIGDVSMLFGPDRSVLAVNASAWQVAGELGGMCMGQSDVQLHSTPGGGPAPQGPTYLGTFDPTGGGTLKVPATGQCTTFDNCNSRGVNVITGFIAPIGATAGVTCIADADATPPNLGYDYVGGPGGDGRTAALAVVRVVDPDALFGICTPDTAVAGSAGTCAAVNRDGDGYP